MTIDIGTTPQLFVDDLIVDETHALTSTLHQPAKYAGNPIDELLSNPNRLSPVPLPLPHIPRVAHCVPNGGPQA